MSANEFLNKEDVDDRKALIDVEKKKATKKKEAQSKRTFVQIMNGEFLSKDNFVKNLSFIFFLGFLLVILISWGYYAETITKKEKKLEEELIELNSEYFTLGSEYNTRRGRRQIEKRLAGTGVKESLISPRKIRVKKYIFESEQRQ